MDNYCKGNNLHLLGGKWGESEVTVKQQLFHHQVSSDQDDLKRKTEGKTGNALKLVSHFPLFLSCMSKLMVA